MLRVTVDVNEDVIATVVIVNRSPRGEPIPMYHWHCGEYHGELLHVANEGWALLAAGVLYELHKDMHREHGG